jgi:hypothetical protein
MRIHREGRQDALDDALFFEALRPGMARQIHFGHPTLGELPQ